MLGVRRPSLNKVLRALERDRLIRISYSEIEVLDRAGLGARLTFRLPGTRPVAFRPGASRQAPASGPLRPPPGSVSKVTGPWSPPA